MLASGDVNPCFDVPLLCRLLDQLVDARGAVRRIDVSETRAHLLLVPHDSLIGSTVVISISGDVAKIFCGVGAQLTIGADEDDADAELVSVVAGILNGGACEYAATDETGELRLMLTVEYERGNYTFPVTDEILLRRIPAWDEVGA
ncbi:MAG: hypothetical protein E6Q27_06240 [Aeromicrobium sp.]|nr:MAG: hypothetical protein E6Q27_06240 [Aeromicrobium sp.]